jgi:hypothetical protein
MDTYAAEGPEPSEPPEPESESTDEPYQTPGGHEPAAAPVPDLDRPKYDTGAPLAPPAR